MTKLNPIHLIYAGGTFGSYGTPLAPLDANDLLPALLNQLTSQREIKSNNLCILKNTCVKDSSQLTPADMVHFYNLISQQYKHGNRQFVLITGTDTLSYLGAFLAEAFTGTNVCIALTASMKPLFDSNLNHAFVVDKNSDAWGNITLAIEVAETGKAGVVTCLSGNIWQSQTVQKINSHNLPAFSGQPAIITKANNDDSLSNQQKSIWLTNQGAITEQMAIKAEKISIPVIYTVPNNAQYLAQQINSLLLDDIPSALIIMGFGAGNIPYSDKLAKVLAQKSAVGHLIVATTQCPFGGVSREYLAGSWQYQHQVLSGGQLTLPAIYARLLWLLLTCDVSNRRSQWTA